MGSSKRRRSRTAESSAKKSSKTHAAQAASNARDKHNERDGKAQSPAKPSPRSTFSMKLRSSNLASSSLMALESPIRKTRASKRSLYRELNRDKKEIRLLIVEPGTDDEMLSVKFKHAFLSRKRKPNYETISYAWGDASKRRTVRLHGKKMMVPDSSERALRRMRYPDRARVLWIDAICINQEDVRERGHQVGIMAEIYGNTSRNLIWLGEEYEDTGAALDSIAALHEEFRLETNDFSDVFDTLYLESGTLPFSSRQSRAEFDPDALKLFLSHPWFSRLWVLQEAALSPQNCCFIGPYEIDLIVVLRAARWLMYAFPSYHDVRPDVIHPEVMSVYARMWERVDHDIFTIGGEPQLMGEMFALLTDLRGFSTSDPKDHVFALLGLWQSYHSAPSIPDLLAPDYELPLSAILRRATQFAMQESRNLSALRVVSHRTDQDEITGLPSWSPRWHEGWDFHLDSTTLFPEDDWPVGEYILLDYDGPTILCVHGTILDCVDQMLYSVLRSFDSVQGAQKFWGDVQSLLEDNISSDANRQNEILSGFVRMQEFGLADEEADLYADLISFLKERGDWLPSRENWHATEETEVLKRVRLGLLSGSRNRLFFITSSKYVGFGPQTMRVGDVLAILAGLDYPAILRPSASYPGDYEFVGVAIVHGIMKGEAVQKFKEEGGQWDVIRLR